VTLALEFGQLIVWAAALLTLFATVVTALVKLLLTQFEKRLSAALPSVKVRCIFTVRALRSVSQRCSAKDGQ
jgi:hypothetical protein